MLMNRPSACALWVSLASLGLLSAACDSSSGGGSRNSIGPPVAVTSPVVHEVESNENSGEAGVLERGVGGAGEVAVPGDVDYWSATLTEDMIVSVELFATRLDQSGWDAGDTAPRLTLYDTDGLTRLLEHDYGGSATASGSWSWGKHDLGFPLFRVPATGTYFLAVSQDDPTRAGGSYAVRWLQRAPDGLSIEGEAESVQGLNDDWSNAEPIEPGFLYGFHFDDDSDYYSFDVGAEGAVVEFVVTSYRNGVWRTGGDSFDPRLDLYDTDGVTRLTGNDDAIFYDSALQYAITSPGTYFVGISHGNNAVSSPYFLSFDRSSLGDSQDEAEPNDTLGVASQLGVSATSGYDFVGAGRIDPEGGTVGDLVDFWSFSGTAGDMVRLQWFDQSNAQQLGGEIEVRLLATDGFTALSFGPGNDLQSRTTILQETGTFFIEVAAAQGGSADYVFNLNLFRDARYESEPNNDSVEANGFDGDSRRAGVIDLAGDRDVFSFEVEADRLTTFAVYASSSATGSDGAFQYSGHGSALAPLLTVRDGTGAVLATSSPTLANGTYTESNTDPLPTASVSFVSPDAETYFLEIEDANGGFGPTHYYVIEKRGPGWRPDSRLHGAGM